MQPEQTVPEPVTSDQPVQTALDIHAKKIPRQRHFLVLFFFSFMWGVFGVDRIYMGFYGTGILKMLTFGGLGFWALTDMIVIMTGTFRDKQGRLTLQAEEYRKFAGRTILWFSIILGVVVLVYGALLILGIFNLVDAFQNGSIPGLSDLQNQIQGASGNQQSQINSLLGQ
ncbi:MAG: phosphotransferase system enzyme [Candidatus Saccharibacteria bacterium]|nr:phosphotransferase system enzyme [Candidatus Saccharibacteria bacterium]